MAQSLLHSLIDGHPEVSTLQVYTLVSFLIISLGKKLLQEAGEEMPDRFVSIYAVLFDASSNVKISTKGKRLIDNIGIDEGLTNVGKERMKFFQSIKKHLSKN